VLNENERNTMGPRYTRCFDAIREGVSKYNPTIKLAGPEIVLGAQGACEAPTLTTCLVQKWATICLIVPA
jgi:hypothetical protein